MKERDLILIELIGRTIVAMATAFVIYSMTNIWLTLVVIVPMFIWILNPIIEFKFYGGS